MVTPQPATPMEKHLVEKVKRLEEAVAQLCKLQGLDFSAAPTVDAAPQGIEQPASVSSADTKHPPVAPVADAFDFGVNMLIFAIYSKRRSKKLLNSVSNLVFSEQIDYFYFSYN